MSLLSITTLKLGVKTFRGAKKISNEEVYQKDGNPCKADVVEGDGALEGVVALRLALGVVLVPVDAGAVGGLVITPGQSRCVAQELAVLVGRYVSAQVHAVVLRLGTDVIAILFLVRVVGRQGSATQHT